MSIISSIVEFDHLKIVRDIIIKFSININNLGLLLKNILLI